jgi:hypothetical protein
MTGRGAGFCAGFGMPGYANPVPGRGFGMGGGRRGGGGRGRRNMYYATGLPGWARSYGQPAYGPPRETAAPGVEGGELGYLKEQARYLGEALSDINQRIDELQKKQEG